MSNENQYDLGYLSGLKMRGERHNYGMYSNRQDVFSNMDDEFKAGQADAKSYHRRNPDKSALANDDDYQSFLATCADVLCSGSKDSLGELIAVEWRTGGVTGGDCWGGKADNPVSGETPEELTAYDQIIEKVAEDISFIKYKNLSAAVVHNTTYSDGGDYYGNYYDFASKYVILPELYYALKERGIL